MGIEYGNSLTKFDSNSSDYVPFNKKTEFQTAHEHKNLNKSNQRLDKIYQTNSEKNINHIYTNEGSVISYLSNGEKINEKEIIEDSYSQMKKNNSMMF